VSGVQRLIVVLRNLGLATCGEAQVADSGQVGIGRSPVPRTRRGLDKGLLKTAAFVILVSAIFPPFVPIAEGVEDRRLGRRRRVLSEGFDRRPKNDLRSPFRNVSDNLELAGRQEILDPSSQELLIQPIQNRFALSSSADRTM
jgi:hypothetical protein